jgi:succinate dehydrogenase/fumarate reductase flavoprotein subunit
VPEPYDLLVVGGGAAGQPAAIEAADLGASVVVLEKTGRLGGNLHVAGGAIAAAGTRRQRAAGVADSPDAHFDDVLRIGRGTADPALLRLAVDGAAETVDWLEALGARGKPFRPDRPWGQGSYVGGTLHEVYGTSRTHLWADEGRTLADALATALAARVASGAIDLHLGTRAVELLRDADGRVHGVLTADGTELHARAVLLATGGYGASRGLVRRFHGARMPVLSQNLPHATGDGLMLAETAGAALTRMASYTAYPGMIEDPTNPGVPAASVVFPPAAVSGAIWVDSAGRRFLSEDTESTDAREEALRTGPGGEWFVVFDADVLATRPPVINPWGPGRLRAEISRGLLVARAESIGGLATKIGLEPTALHETIRRYNADGGRGPLGRREHTPLVRPPFHAIRTLGNLLSTKGGVRVDAGLRVLRPDGRAIPGLYAAGETIGAAQVMGDGVSTGMNIGPAVTFGRAVARTVAAARAERPLTTKEHP